jgi:sugar phosphate isomerase/epimerase
MHDEAFWWHGYDAWEGCTVPGTIVVQYHGRLDREFLEYLAKRGVEVSGHQPLVLGSGDVDDLLQRILGFLSTDTAMVSAISVRRHPRRDVA